MAGMTCSTCGKKGHTARDCPMKKPGREPFPKNLLPWHGHRYDCLCSVTGVIEEDDHADTR